MSLAADDRLGRILEGGDVDGAFFLHGDEPRLRGEAVRRILEAALDPSTRDFNLDVFHGGDVQPENLAAALAMPPMMAPRRAVVLHDAQDLTPTGRKVVEGCLEAFPPGLTFVISARVPDRSRAAFYRKLKDGAHSLEWKAPGEDEIPGWLMERAPRHGFTLARDAAQALASAVGADLGRLESELAKLASAGEESVDRETVTRLVAVTSEVDRWAWLDRVAGREYGKALGELPALLASSRESAVGLLIGMVDQHVYIGLALEGGTRLVSDTLGRAGKRYLKWKAKIYAGQARRWTAGELEEALELMRTADWRAKSGASDRGVLETLLLSLHALREEAA